VVGRKGARRKDARSTRSEEDDSQARGVMIRTGLVGPTRDLLRRGEGGSRVKANGRAPSV
jgi:hypothetical protein